MTTQLVFDNSEQFEELITSQDYDLATSFVESMVKNMFTNQERVSIIEAYFEEEDTIYNFEIDKSNFISNFKEFLLIYEREEDYEGCALIAKAIKTLEDLA
jgi:hypothetical protein